MLLPEKVPTPPASTALVTKRLVVAVNGLLDYIAALQMQADFVVIDNPVATLVLPR